MNPKNQPIGRRRETEAERSRLRAAYQAKWHDGRFYYGAEAEKVRREEQRTLGAEGKHGEANEE